MYYDDHQPPHFHAIYAEHEALFRIDTLEIYKGSLPGRAKSLVIEWAAEHRQQLEENWRRLQEHEPLEDIEPLE
jgi:putative lipoic acid-binding regulatory protein